MSSLALLTFNEDLQYSFTTTGLVGALNNLGVRALDLSDLHRSALVQAVSALDSFFCAEVQRLAVEITLGRRQASGKRIDLKCSPNDLNALLSAPTGKDQELRLRSIVGDSLQKRTFQKSSDISEALRWVGISDAWNRAFGSQASAVREELDAVVERRNAIVHDADRDRTYASTSRLALRGDDTVAAIHTVRSVVHGFAVLF